MTEERQTESMAGTNEPTGDAVVSSGGQTVEEVEAFWRNRQSGQDRAHSAETAALKAQLEAAMKTPAPAPSDESPEAARVRELQAELQTERAARQAASLRAEYPLAAGVLGDAIVALPPEKVAALEAGLDSGAGNAAPPRIDPNMAPRAGTGMQSPQAKPLNEKSKDELLADLRQAAPAYQEAMREGIL